jgi:hAT family C-terminal dimerisation region
MLQFDDPIACVQFWIRHKGRFTTLYEAALRILAIPASQCLSERAFSAAENAQPATRDSMIPSTLSDMIHLRSKAESAAEEN